MKNGINRLLLAVAILGGIQNCYGNDFLERWFRSKQKNVEGLKTPGVDYSDEIKKTEDQIGRLELEINLGEEKILQLAERKKTLFYTQVLSTHGMAPEDVKKLWEHPKKDFVKVTTNLDAARAEVKQNKIYLEYLFALKKQLKNEVEKIDIDKRVDKKVAKTISNKLLKLEKKLLTVLGKECTLSLKKCFFVTQKIVLVDQKTRDDLQHFVISSVAHFGYYLKKLSLAKGEIALDNEIKNFKKRYIERIRALFTLARERAKGSRKALTEKFDGKALLSDATLLLDLEFDSKQFEQDDEQNDADINKVFYDVSRHAQLGMNDDDVKDEIMEGKDLLPSYFTYCGAV